MREPNIDRLVAKKNYKGLLRILRYTERNTDYQKEQLRNKVFDA